MKSHSPWGKVLEFSYCFANSVYYSETYRFSFFLGGEDLRGKFSKGNTFHGEENFQGKLPRESYSG